jgi:hypothetical protein
LVRASYAAAAQGTTNLSGEALCLSNFRIALGVP